MVDHQATSNSVITFCIMITDYMYVYMCIVKGKEIYVCIFNVKFMLWHGAVYGMQKKERERGI